MAGPPESVWPFTLADHHTKSRGLWCANCLDYILRPVARQDAGVTPELENHHQLPESYLDKLTAQGIDFPRRWTVPVHKRPCHQHHPLGLDIQGISDVSAGFLSWLDNNGAFDLGNHDLRAKQYHDLGLCAHSVIVKEKIKLHLKQEGRDNEYWQYKERQLASGAGFRHNVQCLTESQGEPIRPELLLARSNDAANRHDWGKSSLNYQRALALYSGLTRERRERLEPHYALRKAQQADRKRTDVDRAMDACRGLGYSFDTAKVLGSGILLDEGGPENIRKARAYAEDLLESKQTSWLYRAESHFLLACSGASAESAEKIYKHLVAAQYIYVMLALQGTPHPKVPAAKPPNRNAWPGDVLMTNGGLHRLTPKRCLDLRRGIITHSGLQRELLFDIAGWSNCYRGAATRRPAATEH